MKDNDYKPKQLLTKREREVFELLVQDKTTKEIAQELFISQKTVRNHISNVMQYNYELNENYSSNKNVTFLIIFLKKVV
ncbi:LuxR C-terminal-related transcriptional regulator [Gracilibacillus lacisalsi]|uniref:LuxR C-terminal-related transcriptional regulator n=1 Tax=Gracilibacillus lacisalsi TaxID=393087 RepID=UPI00036C053E